MTKPSSCTLSFFAMFSLLLLCCTATFNLRGGNNSNSGHGGKRIFARYQNEKGHKLIESCASSILQDLDDDDIVILQGNGACLHQLDKSPLIVEADDDYPVEAFSFTQQQPLLSLDHHPVVFRTTRTLSEIVPWGIHMIQADHLEPGSEDVVVCIVDTGLALGHPDLASDRITGGDSVKGWKWNTDVFGHGTHITGTIAAMAGNGHGVIGAGNFRLHIARCLDDTGRGYESDIRSAVQQCVDANARVINMSLGGYYISASMKNFYRKIVYEKGIMIVAAAGNNGDSRENFPAAHESVISVTGLYEFGQRYHSSNYGDQVEFAAPGHNVLSTSVSTNSVQTDDFGYPAYHIRDTGEGSATGKLVYCDRKCKNAKDNICLMIYEEVSEVESMLNACEKKGGVGAIFWHSTNVGVMGSLRATSKIPAVGLKEEYASVLAEAILHNTTVVTIGDSDDDDVEFTYTEESGTSVAAPHVTAAAALLFSHFPDCSNHQIRYALAITAYHPQMGGGGGCDENLGHGVVKVLDAFDWLNENGGCDWEVPHLSLGGCTTTNATLLLPWL